MEIHSRRVMGNLKVAEFRSAEEAISFLHKSQEKCFEARFEIRQLDGAAEVPLIVQTHQGKCTREEIFERFKVIPFDTVSYIHIERYAGPVQAQAENTHETWILINRMP